MEFTGEFVVLGKTPKRIELDHVSRYQYVKSRITSRLNILDIACGTGYAATILGPDFASYTGVDILQSNIDFALENYGSSNVHYECSDLLEYKKNGFDVCVCFETIEHISDYKKALSSLHSFLKPGGYLYISSPNREVTNPGKSIHDKPGNRYHTQEFLISELASLLEEHGFTVDRSQIVGQRQFNPRSLYWKFFNPAVKTDSRCTKIEKTPRYFVIEAVKA
jgi:SAM-dependent methyltransferase